ncbi:MAG: PD40 domain-containing protein [Chlamydiia bacterium]|nr:PD40 domain-containing protein [Chlamydiia bacterium]
MRLATQSPLKPVYLTQIHSSPSEYDWRYLDELRGVLEFDLNTNGFCFVQSHHPDWEEHLYWPDVKARFDLPFWKAQKIPYLFAIQVHEKHLSLIAFDLEKQRCKKFGDIALTGRIEQDRRLLHKLSDQLTKEFFGMEGIASLRILYSQRTKIGEADWSSEIWISDIDGNSARQLTQDGGYSLSPAFFPKKEDLEFYYVSYRQGQSKIYRASLAEGTSQVMLSLRGNQALPAMTKRGDQLAFITDIAGRPDLFIQTLDRSGRLHGKARQIYSQPRATQASPTFSPDGKQIAFVSDKDGPPRIYCMEVPAPTTTKRAKTKLLTTKNRENTSPAWSPDGTKLAYSARTEGVRQIWIYDFKTQTEQALTQGEENKENPTWAPDNLHLIYNTENEDTCELYLVNLNDPHPVCISKGEGQKRFASWEPR